MNIQLEHISPNQIEQRSFEIISEELGDMRLDPEQGADYQTLYSHFCGL